MLILGLKGLNTSSTSSLQFIQGSTKPGSFKPVCFTKWQKVKDWLQWLIRSGLLKVLSMAISF